MANHILTVLQRHGPSPRFRQNTAIALLLVLIGMVSACLFVLLEINNAVACGTTLF